MAVQLHNKYVLGEFELDADKYLLKHHNEPVHLPELPFQVLLYLVEHRERYVNRQELLNRFWAGSDAYEETLTKCISTIRTQLNDPPNSPRFIETRKKVGYRYIGPFSERPLKPQSSSYEIQRTRGVQIIFEEQDDEVDSLRVRDRVIRVNDPNGPSRLSASRHSPLVSPRVIVIALGLGALALAFVVWRTRIFRPAETGVLRTMQIRTPTGLESPALSPDGNSIAYSSNPDNGAAEIYVKPLTPGAREIQLTSDGQQNSDPVWSPDGKLIAFRSHKRGGIWVIPATGGMARKLTDFGAWPAWSRDGTLIAFQSDASSMPPTTIWTISTQGGLPRQITQAGAPAGGHSLPSWSPNGKTIAFVAFEGTTPPQLWTTAAVGGELKLLASEFSNPVYSADGNFIYGSSGSHIGGIFGLYRIGVSPNGEAAGERVLIKDTGLARIEGRVTISANGKEIAYNARTVNASLMSLPILPNKREAANSPTLLDPSTSYRKTLPAFSRDGRKIAFVEFRGGEQPKTWVMDADGRNAAQLTTGPGSAWGLKWLPDDDSIAFQSDRGGKAGIWSISISTGKEKLLLEPGQALGWPRLSPDGKQIAFNSTKGGAVNVWTLPLEGGAPRQLTFDSEQMGWPCWSPDGKLLALGMTRGADANIAIMPSTGGAVTQLTFRHGLNSPYDWSPDGDKIIFAGQNDSIWNVYWISLTTKQEKQLTHYTKRNEYVRYPAWSPLGNQIVYEYAETTGNVWLMELK